MIHRLTSIARSNHYFRVVLCHGHNVPQKQEAILYGSECNIVVDYVYMHLIPLSSVRSQSDKKSKR